MQEVETVVAESSPAVVEATHEPEKPKIDPLQEGPMGTWTREQRNEFRSTGKMPEVKPKAAPAPASVAPAESVAESETAKQQEHTEKHTSKPKQTAEQRIEQLEATIEKIRKGAGIERTAKTESSTSNPASKEEKPAPPRNYQEWRKTFKAPEWVQEYAKANPEATYEDANAAMADYLADVRDQYKDREAQQQALAKELDAKVADAKARYPNYQEVIDPAIDAILNDKDIVGVVKAMLNESEVLPDLMFTIGSKPEELAKFVKMAKESPGTALRYVALTESLIREELENAKSTPEEKVTPAKQQTSAPKPPAEVGGRATAPGDALVAAATANDFRAFKTELNRRSLARMKTG